MEKTNKLCPINLNCFDFPDDEIMPDYCENRNYCRTVGRALLLPYRVNYRYLEVEIWPIYDEYSGTLQEDVDKAYRKELEEYGWANAAKLPFSYISDSNLPFPVLAVSFTFTDEYDNLCDKYDTKTLAMVKECGWAEAEYINNKKLRESYTLDYFNCYIS